MITIKGTTLLAVIALTLLMTEGCRQKKENSQEPEKQSVTSQPSTDKQSGPTAVQKAKSISLPTSAQLTSNLKIVVHQVVRPNHARARYGTVKNLPDATYEDWEMTRGSIFSETVKKLEQPPGTVLLEIMALIQNEGDNNDEVRIRGFELVFDTMSIKPWELLPGNVFGSYDRMAEKLHLSDQPPDAGELLVMIEFGGGLICSLDAGKRTFIAIIFAVPKDLEIARLKIEGEETLIAQIDVPTK